MNPSDDEPQIGVDQDGTRRTTTSVHPEVMPLRRSRAQRANGLALHWPALSRSEAEDDVFVIDIVNTGESRWRPDGDPFLVVGVFSVPGTENAGTSFGYMSGQNPAVPLDPGDYARVRISIEEGQCSTLEPGRHELHAMLAMLPVRSASPLTIELTEEQIDRHRSRLQARSRPALDRHESLRRRQQHLQALIDGASKIELIARLVADAVTDDAARAEAALVLEGDDEAVAAVIGTSLEQFSKEAVQRMRDQVRQIEQLLVSPADSD